MTRTLAVNGESPVKLERLALECGFTKTASLDPSKIVTRSEVRDACAEDKCDSYGKNWACPPFCGSLADCADRIRGCGRGIIMQTTGALEDEFDYEGMLRLGREHEKHIADFAAAVLAEHEGEPARPRPLILGAGPCRVCESCRCPQAPCRFPQRMTSSMEAFGMVVSDVCASCGIPYYYGKGTLTYVGCCLTLRATRYAQ